MQKKHVLLEGNSWDLQMSKKWRLFLDARSIPVPFLCGGNGTGMERGRKGDGTGMEWEWNGDVFTCGADATCEGAAGSIALAK